MQSEKVCCSGKDVYFHGQASPIFNFPTLSFNMLHSGIIFSLPAPQASIAVETHTASSRSCGEIIKCIYKLKDSCLRFEYTGTWFVPHISFHYSRKYSPILYI